MLQQPNQSSSLHDGRVESPHEEPPARMAGFAALATLPSAVSPIVLERLRKPASADHPGLKLTVAGCEWRSETPTSTRFRLSGQLTPTRNFDVYLPTRFYTGQAYGYAGGGEYVLVPASIIDAANGRLSCGAGRRFGFGGVPEKLLRPSPSEDNRWGMQGFILHSPRRLTNTWRSCLSSVRVSAINRYRCQLEPVRPERPPPGIWLYLCLNHILVSGEERQRDRPVEYQRLVTTPYWKATPHRVPRPTRRWMNAAMAIIVQLPNDASATVPQDSAG